MKPRYTDRHRYPHGYKPACATNITATFERARRAQEKIAARDRANEAEAEVKAVPIAGRRATR